MKVFLDANILVAVLNKEYPLFTTAARILSLADNYRYTLYTSPVCLAIAFYFAEKKCGSKQAKKKIALLAEHILVASCGENEVKKAASDPRILDFEDGIEYYAALSSDCTCLVTEDTGDFHFSDIEVLPSEAFLKKYVLFRQSET